MATLPADRNPDDDHRKATVWWPWLIAVAVVLLLLWLLLGRRGADNEAGTTTGDSTTQVLPDETSPNAGVDDGVTADTDAAAAGATGAAAGAAVTNAQDLYGESLASFVGRRVEIDDATVLSVTGDSTFYVGADGRRFLVALSGLGERATGPGAGGEDGRFDIDTGDRVSIRGTVERFDAANRVFGRLSEADRTEGTTRGAFVNVTRAADVTRR